jgi:predicted Na+-dependent transporter
MTLHKAKLFGLGFNAFFEKYIAFIIPVSLIFGFIFYPWLHGLTYAIPGMFAYLTFVMALGCSGEQIKRALRMPIPMAITFALVHLIAPSVAYLLGVIIFGEGSPYVIGMVLFAAIPLGVSSVIWVGMSGGNVPLVLSMIVLDSAMSPFIVPLLVSLFFGAHIEFDHLKVMRDLALIIVVPTIIGVLINELTRGKAKLWSAPVSAPTSKLAFAGVVMINAAAITPHVMELKSDMYKLVPVVVVLVALCYVIGFLGSLALRNQELTITLTYSSGMRNISLGVVIGLGYFEPLVAVPVVVSILVQQPMATLNHWLMEKYKQRRKSNVQATGLG